MRGAAGLARQTESLPDIEAGERKTAAEGSGAHAGDGLQFALRGPIEGERARGVGVMREGQNHAGGEDAFGMVARVHAGEAVERAQEEAGACDHEYRDGDLRYGDAAQEAGVAGGGGA